MNVFLRNHANTSPYDKSLVKEILPKNGSLKLKIISSADSKQYCLSLHAPQPFSRGSLCIWRPWKHRENVSYTWFWFCFMAQPVYIETCIAEKRLVIFEKIFRHRIENNIAFHLIPSSHSAAADWVYGVPGIIDIRMYSCAIMPAHPHMARV